MGDGGLSASDALLIFLDTRNEFEGWLQLKGAEISARGLSLEAIPGLVDAETREPLRVAAIVPGEAVSVHWLEVPAGLAPAQAIAAARTKMPGEILPARVWMCLQAS